MDQVRTDAAREVVVQVADFDASLARPLAGPFAGFQQNVAAQMLASVREIQLDIVRHAHQVDAAAQMLASVREIQLDIVRHVQADIARQFIGSIVDLQRSVFSQLGVSAQLKVLAQLSYSFGYWNSQANSTRQSPANQDLYPESTAPVSPLDAEAGYPADALAAASTSQAPVAKLNPDSSKTSSSSSWLRQYNVEIMQVLAALSLLLTALTLLIALQGQGGGATPSQIEQIVRSILKSDLRHEIRQAPGSCHAPDRR